MVWFISPTIWLRRSAPLVLIAFPGAAVEVIGCSKAALPRTAEQRWSRSSWGLVCHQLPVTGTSLASLRHGPASSSHQRLGGVGVCGALSLTSICLEEHETDESVSHHSKGLPLGCGASSLKAFLLELKATRATLQDTLFAMCRSHLWRIHKVCDAFLSFLNDPMGWSLLESCWIES